MYGYGKECFIAIGIDNVFSIVDDLSTLTVSNVQSSFGLFSTVLQQHPVWKSSLFEKNV